LGFALGAMAGAAAAQQQQTQQQVPVCYAPNGNPYFARAGTEDGGVRIMNKLIPALFLLSLLDDRAHAECTIMDDGQATITPPVPPLRRGSAEHRSSSFPKLCLPFAVGAHRPSTQVEFWSPEAIAIAGLPAKTPVPHWEYENGGGDYRCDTNL